MFKNFLIIFGCLLPTISFAQTNDINTHGYFNFHGGSLPINAKTIIDVDGVDYVIGDLIKQINEGFGNISTLEAAIQQAGLDAQTALNLANQAQTTANNAIPLSQKGIANGVAMLNANKNITNPVIGSVAAAPANAAGDTVSSIADIAKSAQATASGAVQANGGDASKTVVTPTGGTQALNLKDISAQAIGSVQKDDANQPNGYAKLDLNKNVTSPLLNNTRVGGSDTGTDISNAVVDTAQNTTKSYLYSTQTRPRYIFFGGADNFQLAAQLSPAFIQSGKVGLYEHANGVAPLSDADRAAIQATFAPTGSNLVNGGGDAMGEIGLTTAAGYVGYFKGKYPVEDNTNYVGSGTFTASDGTVLGNYFTADDLKKYKASVDAVIPLGAKNIAPAVTPNGVSNSISTDFGTEPYWENIRAAALYGGAIAIDTPPSYALLQGDTYMKEVISEIKWGLANHLRVTVILSPFNPLASTQPDTQVWNNTARYLDALIRAGAVPTSYVVETYCGCTTTTPLVGSSELSGSMDHLVSMLLTVPVSPPGTAVPQSKVPGGASEANAFAPISIGHTIGSTNTSPTYVNVIADVNNPAYGTNIIGSMGFQSADNALIVSGKIGSSGDGVSALDVFLSGKSSFLTQVPLTFQGSGPNGNSDLEGGSDQWVHLNNRYTTDVTNIGMAFGTDANAPIISRTGDATGGLQIKAGSAVHIYPPIIQHNSIIFPGGGGGANGNAVLSAGDADQWLHLSNPYTTDVTNIGLMLGTDTDAPRMSRFGNEFGFFSGVYFHNDILLQGGTAGNPSMNGADDGLVHIHNDYSTTDYTTGIALGNSVGDPIIAVTNDRTTMKITASNIVLTGAAAFNNGLSLANTSGILATFGLDGSGNTILSPKNNFIVNTGTMRIGSSSAGNAVIYMGTLGSDSTNTSVIYGTGGTSGVTGSGQMNIWASTFRVKSGSLNLENGNVTSNTAGVLSIPALTFPGSNALITATSGSNTELTIQGGDVYHQINVSADIADAYGDKSYAPNTISQLLYSSSANPARIATYTTNGKTLTTLKDETSSVFYYNTNSLHIGTYGTSANANMFFHSSGGNKATPDGAFYVSGGNSTTSFQGAARVKAASFSMPGKSTLDTNPSVTDNTNQIATTNYVQGQFQAVTYASLPSSPVAWQKAICTDCYINSGNTGMVVIYNPTRSMWTTFAGTPVQH